MKSYEITIGVECHVQLNTRTKLFSGVSNDATGKEANTCVSPVDYALPGMLPILNKVAVEKAVRAGLAMNCKINLESRFDRKHYFYPDLPKGYQISQFYMPIVGEGTVELADGSIVRIERAHLEEDAGKLTHYADYSLVDLNRAGTPLIEIVSKPDIHSALQARTYCEELHRLMTYSNVTNGDMYQGNMRFDINISLAEEGSEKLGTRAEIKNLNSFRSIERAVEYEYKRQKALLEKGKPVNQETRGWDDVKNETFSQRSKEEAQDYRYMPEPDVPPVVLTTEFVNKIAATMPRLPKEYRELFKELRLDTSELTVILDHQILAIRLAEVMDIDIKLASRVAHLFSGTLLAEENLAKDFSLAKAAELAELSTMLEKQELSSTAAKEVFVALYEPRNTGKSAKDLAKDLNLLQENDVDALSAVVDEVLKSPECAQAVIDIRNGEEKAIGFVIGQIMRRTKGKANPAMLRELVKQNLL